jgi:LysM repeat protein
MNKRSSAPARVVATIALVGGFILLIAVIATSLGGDDDDGKDRAPAVQMGKQGGGDEGEPPKSYVVQNGDTLTSIARKTGVPVSSIEELNPGVDPQILVSGEKLKLR